MITAESSIPGLKLISSYRKFNTSANAILGFSTTIFEIFSDSSKPNISLLLDVIIAEAEVFPKLSFNILFSSKKDI